MNILNDRPINAEAPSHLLDSRLTPNDLLFVRNNGIPPANRFVWQDFSASVRFPQNGYYEIWTCATDGDGISRPMILPGWNPRGYLNNACHRIAVLVGA